jgi:hypothetical protein
MPVREWRALAGMKALVTYPCVLGVELVVGEEHADDPAAA